MDVGFLDGDRLLDVAVGGAAWNSRREAAFPLLHGVGILFGSQLSAEDPAPGPGQPPSLPPDEPPPTVPPEQQPTCTDDAAEDDDDLTRAVLIESTVGITRVSCPSDPDYSVINVPTGTTLTATVAPAKGLDAQVDLYDSKAASPLQTINASGPGGTEVTTFKNKTVQDQTVYVRVTGVAGLGAYELTATVTG